MIKFQSEAAPLIVIEQTSNAFFSKNFIMFGVFCDRK